MIENVIIDTEEKRKTLMMDVAMAAVMRLLGDEMYFFSYNARREIRDIICLKTTSFIFHYDGSKLVKGEYVECGRKYDIVINFCQLGKTLFFTREEAEKAREKELNKEKSNVQDKEDFPLELEKAKNMADEELKKYIKAMAGEIDDD